MVQWTRRIWRSFARVYDDTWLGNLPSRHALIFSLNCMDMNLSKAASILKIDEQHIKNVLDYIEKFWPKLIRVNRGDAGTLIGLPNPYVVPAESEFFQEMYYWDSYPVILALLDHPKYSKLAIGMVENLLYLVERFGIIPNATRFYFLSRSQPPLLSHAVWHVYEKTKDKKWFERAIGIVEYEYRNVWVSEKHPNSRKVYEGLSRYYDMNVLHNLAEAESGWDMTARYSGNCLDYLPIDLNCLLYVYEEDFVKAYQILDEPEKVKYYQKKAKARAKKINELMWNQESGYWFDFNFVREHISPYITVAGFYPVTVGLASVDQAKKAADVIENRLLRKYGVVQSLKFIENKQWDWPNGWALMHLRVIEGLMAYGHDKLALKIVRRWIKINVDLFRESGKLWEKYDVVNGRIGIADRYPTQHGFAWTNACFLLLMSIAEQLEDSTRERKKVGRKEIAPAPAF